MEISGNWATEAGSGGKIRWPFFRSNYERRYWQRATHLVAVQDLGDASVGDPQLARDDAGTDSCSGHLHDLQADVAGQRSSVDEDASQLIDTSLASGRHVT